MSRTMNRTNGLPAGRSQKNQGDESNPVTPPPKAHELALPGGGEHKAGETPDVRVTTVAEQGSVVVQGNRGTDRGAVDPFVVRLFAITAAIVVLGFVGVFLAMVVMGREIHPALTGTLGSVLGFVFGVPVKMPTTGDHQSWNLGIPKPHRGSDEDRGSNSSKDEESP
jgi:hypothetical protein